MKKLLLSLIAVAGFTGLAYAETAEFNFKLASEINKWGYETPAKAGNGVDAVTTKPITDGNVSIVIDTKDANTGGGKLRFWFPTNNTNTNCDLRCSGTGGGKSQTMTFTANGGTITNIVFTASKIALTPSTGTLSALSSGSATWTGTGTEIVFTTTGENKYTAIKVTYAPSGKEAAGLSFETPAVSIVQGETYAGQTVKNPNNLTVTYSTSDENIAEVDANTGAVTMGTELGTATITAKFAGNDQFAEGSASYTITVVKAVANLSEFNALAKGDEAIINCELTVTYCDASSNAFVTDGTNYQLIYKYGVNYKQGDVLNSGWKAKMDNYQGLPEMIPVGDLPSVKEEGTYTPDEITAADVTEANINRVVVLKNVVFAAATPAADASAANRNYTGKVGDTEINFFNKFKNASVEAGTYNVTGVVGINGAKLQITPISFEATTTNAIDSIVADDAAEAEYYNLQGVRVAAPESGLYIVRRGNKVTKELVK